MKKLLSICLALALLLVSIPLGAFTLPAAAASTEGYYTYEVTGGKATITDVDTSISGDVTIPSTLGGYPVTAIAGKSFPNYGAFGGCNKLTSITIPDGVTSIGDRAFEACTNLSSITIPDSVISIGEFAFTRCNGLTGVYIANMEAWCEILFGSSEANPLHYAHNLYLNGKLVTDLVIPDSVMSVGDYAFYNCDSITSITIPDGVTSIGMCTFSSCDGLTSVTIPDSVTTIGREVFCRCTSLTSITIPNSVTAISMYAFAYCDGLTSVTIPDSVMFIDSVAFFACYKLVEVYNHSSLSITKGSTDYGYVGYYALNVYTPTSGKSKMWTDDSGYIFYEDGNECYLLSYAGSETTLTLPQNCNGRAYAIYRYAFSHYKSLISITIPKSITRIGYDAFSYYSSLTDVYYRGSEATKNKMIIDDYNSKLKNAMWHYNSCIGSAAHTYTGNYDAECNICGDVREVAWQYTYEVVDGKATITGVEGTISGDVVIPATLGGYPVTAIGWYAFEDCTGLTSITIPDSVTSIGNGAFSSCKSLTSITIPDSVTSIGGDAFYNTAFYNNNSNWINNVLYIGNHLIVATPPLSGAYTIKEGTVTIADNAFFCCPSLTSVTIPDSVTSIGGGAFADCTGLTSITLPDSVTSIGRYAFFFCTGLTGITIGNSVTSIGNYAFESCTSLTSVTIPGSVTSIGCAFFNCTGLTSITIGNGVASIENAAFFNCGSLTSVTIPDSVTSIDDYAFERCAGLTSITIPNSVTSVGEQAFYGCNALTDVYYRGSEEDRKALSIGSENDYLTSATWYYNACIGSAEHTYDNAYDNSCNVCGDVREVETRIQVIAGETINFELSEADCYGITGDITYSNRNLFSSITPVNSAYGIIREHKFILFSSASAVDLSVSLSLTISNTALKGDSCVITFEYLRANSNTDLSDVTECTKTITVEIVKPDAHTPGDINGNGTVNNRDAIALIRYLNDWDEEVIEAALDVNGDGSINNRDALTLTRYLNDWDVSIK